MLTVFSRIAIIRNQAPCANVVAKRFMRTKANPVDNTSPPIDDLFYENYGISDLDEKDLVTLHQAGWSVGHREQPEPEYPANASTDIANDKEVTPKMSRPKNAEPNYYFRGFGRWFHKGNPDVDPTKIHLYKRAFDEAEWHLDTVAAEDHRKIQAAQNHHEAKKDKPTEVNNETGGAYYRKLGYRRYSIY